MDVTPEPTPNALFARRWRALLIFVVALLTASLGLSGCATTGGNPLAAGMQVFEDARGRYIDVSTPDPCATLREPFVEVREVQRREIAKWAAIGASAGAAGGAAIDRNNRLRGLLIGALTGALAGATIGYYTDLQERAEGTSALRRAVFTDARGDRQRSDRLVGAVAKLNQCRMRSLKSIATAVRKGQISKDEARARLAAVKRATREDNQLIDSVSAGLTKRTNIYVNALQRSGAEDADAYIARAEAYRPVVRKPQFAVSRPTAQVSSISLTRRDRRGENSVEGVAKNAAELEALQLAHREAVDDGIEDINALLL
ncbi:YMGG-like glycine zipper-containing protein [Marichromatium bheemlicum]|uniref:Glycine zipper 2TM domain-containing protein n=1 Tax=Marichromatium bheemlicum TaxID=365339 RepID=A0ABX1I401_9GAMM|nr:YMGG-like glycine zipper-containing protein [Marichromatium bheemlicum]NKN31694.1 glycine zipper 2TM domain-containing protein [Marichromatium bheemlicum]